MKILDHESSIQDAVKLISKREAEAIKGITMARDSRVHISAIMLMKIVDQLSLKTGHCYIGEAHGYYQSVRVGGAKTADYTYGGVGSMLRKLAKGGYLKRARDSQYVNYSLTKKGIALLDGMHL